MNVVRNTYDILLHHFGPQQWWPGDSPFEVAVGAILTQNTAWTNVEKAIENLRGDNALSPEAMADLPTEELAELIRPAGYYRLKAKRLKNFVEFLRERYDGQIEKMASIDLSSARDQLLSVNGIGPETADSILLYALARPTFVVDAYTARLTKRHEWIDPDADYYDIKDYFESSLEAETELFNEYHALIVRLGKTHCRTTPDCETCPLMDLLPESGPADVRR